jgi:curved DNA-binding protein CbpA
MSETPFVDHYEALQLSQNADAETVERVYRLLAKRYHPDNAASGDADRFREIHDAYEILSDAKTRARYDASYDDYKSVQWTIFEQGTAFDDQEQDRRIFAGVLSLLYAARRKDPEAGGLGQIHLERMLGVPREHLEFPLWYLRKRGWIETLHTGEVAITVDGIDKIASAEMQPPKSRLLSDGNVGSGTASPVWEMPDRHERGASTG